MDKYTVIREISSGSFGTTTLVCSKATNNEYLMKTCDLRHITKEKRVQLANEVTILKSFNHRNIPKYRESFIQQRLTNE